MIWTDCSVARCLILIENSKFKWLNLPPHVFPQSCCSIHFHLDTGRWQNIQQEPTGGYGDDFLYFILVQALGNFFNLPLYSINSPYSLDLPLQDKDQLEIMALIPFFGRWRAGSLWDPWDRNNSNLFDLWDSVVESPNSIECMCAGLKKEELKIKLVDKGSLRITGERHK
jgi:hypothetical protein